MLLAEPAQFGQRGSGLAGVDCLGAHGNALLQIDGQAAATSAAAAFSRTISRRAPAIPVSTS